ncbi:3-hydroxyalkanoate synthetase, partial [Halomonas sp. MCCC 1A11081]|nr:3-hydroxyalkanoate synthetase [Halomonas ethanolica]
RDSLEHIEHVLAASGELSEQVRKRYEHIRELFGEALERVEPAASRQALVALHDEVAAEAKAEVAARDEVEKMLQDAETKVDPSPAKAAPAKRASRGSKATAPKAT